MVLHLINLLTALFIMTALLIFPPWIPSVQSQSSIEAGNFSAEAPENTLPPGWKPLTFKKIDRHTTYTLVKDNDTVVIKAVAEASASGLTREIKINPKEYPIIQWRWKVVIS